MLYILAIIALSAPVHAWDWFSPSKAPARVATIESRPRPGPAPICLSKTQQSKQNRYTCPAAEELYKDGRRWKTDSGWKSHQNSFTDGISHFMGAQWKGIGIGMIYCIYQPTDPADFPVQLTIEPLAIRPEFAFWEDAPKKDSLNCISQNDPCMCQFSLYIEDTNRDVDEILFEIQK